MSTDFLLEDIDADHLINEICEEVEKAKMESKKDIKQCVKDLVNSIDVHNPRCLSDFTPNVSTLSENVSRVDDINLKVPSNIFNLNANSAFDEMDNADTFSNLNPFKDMLKNVPTRIADNDFSPDVVKLTDIVTQGKVLEDDDSKVVSFENGEVFMDEDASSEAFKEGCTFQAVDSCKDVGFEDFMIKHKTCVITHDRTNSAEKCISEVWFETKCNIFDAENPVQERSGKWSDMDESHVAEYDEVRHQSNDQDTLLSQYRTFESKNETAAMDKIIDRKPKLIKLNRQSAITDGTLSDALIDSYKEFSKKEGISKKRNFKKEMTLPWYVEDYSGSENGTDRLETYCDPENSSSDSYSSQINDGEDTKMDFEELSNEYDMKDREKLNDQSSSKYIFLVENEEFRNPTTTTTTTTDASSEPYYTHRGTYFENLNREMDQSKIPGSSMSENELVKLQKERKTHVEDYIFHKHCLNSSLEDSWNVSVKFVPPIISGMSSEDEIITERAFRAVMMYRRVCRGFEDLCVRPMTIIIAENLDFLMFMFFMCLQTILVGCDIILYGMMKLWLLACISRIKAESLASIVYPSVLPVSMPENVTTTTGRNETEGFLTEDSSEDFSEVSESNGMNSLDIKVLPSSVQEDRMEDEPPVHGLEYICKNASPFFMSSCRKQGAAVVKVEGSPLVDIVHLQEKSKHEGNGNTIDTDIKASCKEVESISYELKERTEVEGSAVLDRDEDIIKDSPIKTDISSWSSAEYSLDRNSTEIDDTDGKIRMESAFKYASNSDFASCFSESDCDSMQSIPESFTLEPTCSEREFPNYHDSSSMDVNVSDFTSRDLLTADFPSDSDEPDDSVLERSSNAEIVGNETSLEFRRFLDGTPKYSFNQNAAAGAGNPRSTNTLCLEGSTLGLGTVTDKQSSPVPNLDTREGFKNLPDMIVGAAVEVSKHGDTEYPLGGCFTSTMKGTVTGSSYGAQDRYMSRNQSFGSTEQDGAGFRRDPLQMETEMVSEEFIVNGSLINEFELSTNPETQSRNRGSSFSEMSGRASLGNRMSTMLSNWKNMDLRCVLPHPRRKKKKRKKDSD